MKIDKDTELLLPWLHNNTLEGREAEIARQSAAENEEHASAEKMLDDAIMDTLKNSQAATPGEFGWHRLQRDIAREAVEQQKSVKRNWFKPAIAAALAVIVIQSGLILQNYRQQTEYMPLGKQTQHPVVLQVEFNPDASERSIRELLGRVDGQLIDGPGALGIYRVALDLKKEDAKAIESAISILGDNSAVVSRVSRE